MPFGVIHQDIFDSSLAADYQARHLFQDLIVLADENDNVMMDALRIAYRTRIPIDVVEHRLAFLCAPDPLDKSKLEEGRRITPILNGDGTPVGYHIVNRHHYKRLISRSRRREYMRLYRAKKQDEAWKALNAPKG